MRNFRHIFIFILISLNSNNALAGTCYLKNIGSFLKWVRVYDANNRNIVLNETVRPGQKTSLIRVSGERMEYEYHTEGESGYHSRTQSYCDGDTVSF